MWKLFIAFVLTLVPALVRAQKDTVMLKQAIVYGFSEEKYLAGSSISAIDSSLQKTYSSNHLGEALSFQFPVYFRNYGSGMISGISMRGTAPQHTAVLWNGININSFSLGQADFSILPVVAADEIKIHTGGGSARFGSGAFGGSVLLSSSAQQSSLLSVKQEVGSFGRYFTSVKASVRAGALTSTTSLYHLQSKNNFPVPAINERQPHAAYKQQGFVEDLNYDISSNKNISMHYWYHEADREIQPSIGKYNSTDEQQDRNHRLSISYQQNNVWGKLKAGGGLVDDVIVYNGNKSEIFRWISFVNHQYTFARQWNVQFSADWNHIIGKIKEYNGTPQENRVDVAASVQKNFKDNSFSLNLRQPFISNVHAPLLPYLGANILIFKNNNHQFIFTSNVSKNFRAPTFNDRYWQNAGQRNLLPETSHAAEAGLNWKFKILNFNTKGFYQLVDQWIQWLPDANGNYRPENIKQVKARGVETSAETHWSKGEFLFHSKIAYQFTKSTASKTSAAEASAIGKQLIYTPLHTGSAFVSTQFKKWSANLFAQYSGRRFTEASNSKIYALDAFILVDFTIGKTFSVKRSEFSLQASVKNILNTQYQLYSANAMPGRYFNLQFSYQLKSK